MLFNRCWIKQYQWKIYAIPAIIDLRLETLTVIRQVICDRHCPDIIFEKIRQIFPFIPSGLVTPTVTQDRLNYTYSNYDFAPLLPRSRNQIAWTTILRTKCGKRDTKIQNIYAGPFFVRYRPIQVPGQPFWHFTNKIHLRHTFVFCL